MTTGHFRDLEQLLPGHGAPGRIRRKRQHEHLRLRRDHRLNGLSRHRETIFGLASHWHRHRMSQNHAGRVTDIARLVVNDFITGVEHRPESQVQSLANTDRHQHLRLRVIANPEVLLDIVRNALAQFQQAQVGSVLGTTAFQSVNRRLTNMPRGGKIWLSDPQRNHTRGVLDEFEEVANTRARDPRDVVGDEVAMNGGHGRLWGVCELGDLREEEFPGSATGSPGWAVSGGSGGKVRLP